MSDHFDNYAELTGYASIKTDLINPFPQTSTQIIKTGWSVDICKDKALALKIPIELNKADTQRTLITQFLNFWLTGNVLDNFNESDIILAVASMIQRDNARNSEDLIWPSNYYSNDPSVAYAFSVKKVDITTPPVPPPSKDDDRPDVILVSDEVIQALGSQVQYDNTVLDDTYKPKVRVEEDTTLLIQKVGGLLEKYSNKHKEFLELCNLILARSPASGAPTLELLGLYKLCNFVALTMLRATVKTKAQMVTGYLKKQYKTNISTFSTPNFGKLFSPPCDKCIETVSYHITKARQPVSSTIAKIVILSIEQPTVKAALDAAVLTHTSWHGMGILHMLFDICEEFGKSWMELYHSTLLNSTVMTWKQIIAFLDRYQKLDNPDLSAPWARVIDDGYFTKFGPSNHIVLASIFKRSIEYVQGDEGITEALWVQRHFRVVENCADASEWLLNKLIQQGSTSAAGHKESLGLAAAMNKKRKEESSQSDSPSGQQKTGLYDDL